MAIVVWGFVAILAAVVTGIAFGLRMASIASESLPAWVPRLEMYTWVALPVWFVLALGRRPDLIQAPGLTKRRDTGRASSP